MRKFMASLGFVAVCVALARLAFASPFLTERAKGATGLLFAADLFTSPSPPWSANEPAGAGTCFFLWRAPGKLI
jgi:hypothetical protein